MKRNKTQSILGPSFEERHLLEKIPPQELISLFDLIPETLFWIKDAEGKIVATNSLFRENFNLGTAEQAEGLTDLDFCPRHIAESIIKDDQRVMQGEPINDLLEINSLNVGDIGWFSTTKRPLYDQTGECIGTYGISLRLSQTTLDRKFMNQLKEPLDYIRRQYDTAISVKAIAEHCNLSVSALERRFQKFLGKTPNQFLNEFRLIAGHRQLLTTGKSIADISVSVGFSDPGYFTRMYTRHYGQNPTESRKHSNFNCFTADHHDS